MLECSSVSKTHCESFFHSSSFLWILRPFQIAWLILLVGKTGIQKVNSQVTRKQHINKGRLVLLWPSEAGTYGSEGSSEVPSGYNRSFRLFGWGLPKFSKKKKNRNEKKKIHFAEIVKSFDCHKARCLTVDLFHGSSYTFNGDHRFHCIYLPTHMGPHVEKKDTCCFWVLWSSSVQRWLYLI